MAGILNKKERVMDFIITKEGKRQATAGQMKIEYAAFTDMHTFYELSGSKQNPDLAEDASSRIFFEAADRYQDTIVPEIQAGSFMRPFRTSDFQFNGKCIASGTFHKGFITHLADITGSDLKEKIEQSLNGITQNFNDMMILATEDPFSDTTEFELSQVTGSFYFNNKTIFNKTLEGNISLEAAESVYADKRFSHLPNFSYLPPINMPSQGYPEGRPVGNYPKLNEAKILSYSDLSKTLEGKQKIEITFPDTSRDNNMLGQVFEFSNDGIEKLSIIDFGEFSDNDPYSPGKRVFFIGKLLKDATGTETFMNIFTMVFD